MSLLKITDGYINLIYCTDNENKGIKIKIKYFLLSTRANILIFSLLGLVIYTMIKHLLANKKWRN